jgi:hypothetical protein
LDNISGWTDANGLARPSIQPAGLAVHHYGAPEMNGVAEALQPDVRPNHVGRSSWLSDLDPEDNSKPRSVAIEGFRVVRCLEREGSRVQSARLLPRNGR